MSDIQAANLNETHHALEIHISSILVPFICMSYTFLVQEEYVDDCG